ncbi:hypothetical protein HDV05_005634 [Chytridiales sp. JEL 0842]|nr:hypothetical protein HDV05_005634 [Chytridiales sp. JEL 0842]
MTLVLCMKLSLLLSWISVLLPHVQSAPVNSSSSPHSAIKPGTRCNPDAQHSQCIGTQLGLCYNNIWLVSPCGGNRVCVTDGDEVSCKEPSWIPTRTTITRSFGSGANMATWTPSTPSPTSTKITVDSVTYEGSGCPTKESVNVWFNQTYSDVATLMLINFTSYNASIKGNLVTWSTDTKTCSLSFKITVPNNMVYYIYSNGIVEGTSTDTSLRLTSTANYTLSKAGRQPSRTWYEDGPIKTNPVVMPFRPDELRECAITEDSFINWNHHQQVHIIVNKNNLSANYNQYYNNQLANNDKNFYENLYSTVPSPTSTKITVNSVTFSIKITVPNNVVYYIFSTGNVEGTSTDTALRLTSTANYTLSKAGRQPSQTDYKDGPIKTNPVMQFRPNELNTCAITEDVIKVDTSLTLRGKSTKTMKLKQMFLDDTRGSVTEICEGELGVASDKFLGDSTSVSTDVVERKAPTMYPGATSFHDYHYCPNYNNYYNYQADNINDFYRNNNNNYYDYSYAADNFNILYYYYYHNSCYNSRDDYNYNYYLDHN